MRRGHPRHPKGGHWGKLHKKITNKALRAKVRRETKNQGAT